MVTPPRASRSRSVLVYVNDHICLTKTVYTHIVGKEKGKFSDIYPPLHSFYLPLLGQGAGAHLQQSL